MNINNPLQGQDPENQQTSKITISPLEENVEKQTQPFEIDQKSSPTFEMEEKQLKNLKIARSYLYVSFFFERASKNAWEFCLALFLGAICDYKSLILVSTYGLVEGLSICLLGGKVGRLVDDYPRLYIVQWMILLKNCSILVATWCCFELLSMSTTNELRLGLNEGDGASELSGWVHSHFNGVPISTQAIFMLVGLHLLGPMSGLLYKGLAVAIERDWIVVMSEVAGKNKQEEHVEHFDASIPGDDSLHSYEKKVATEKWLSSTNVFIKQIHLICKVLVPILSGFFVALCRSSESDENIDPSQTSAHDLRWAALLVGCFYLGSLVAEYICVTKIYHLIPALSSKKNETLSIGNPENSCDNKVDGNKDNMPNPKCCVPKMLSGFAVYRKQSVSLVGIALSLLYVNTLTFGPIMTAYVVWRGMRVETVGVWRGIASVMGLIGTKVFSLSVSSISLPTTGLWSITFQFSCITISFVSLFIQNYNASLSMLIIGVCASRLGLWVFDITCIQLMQQNVPSQIRGIIGGIQESLNAFGILLAYGIGIIYPDPNEFFIMAGVGYLSVGIASFLYDFWYYRSS